MFFRESLPCCLFTKLILRLGHLNSLNKHLSRGAFHDLITSAQMLGYQRVELNVLLSKILSISFYLAPIKSISLMTHFLSLQGYIYVTISVNN